MRIIPAELLTDSGTANQKHTGSPHVYTYILKGDGIEKWNPRFSYYGFRYLQVVGAEPKGSAYKEYPVLQKIEGWHLRNSTAVNGSFRSSNDLFNKTHQLIQWALNSNFTSVFTDCPHREKLGWQEQVHLMGNAIQHNYDIVSFAHKIMRDIRTQQLTDGLVPATVPEFTEMHFADGYFRDSPEWGSTSIIFPWYMYQWTGDKRLLTENYTAMQRYFKYLQSKDSSFILMHGLSDWYDLGPDRQGFSQLTPMGLTATAYYYYDAHLLEQIATALGNKEDAKMYQKIALDIKEAFNKKYFNAATKQYGSGSQTSNAIPLFMQLVEPQHYDAVLAHLVEDIRNKDNRLTAGDIGYRYVLKALEAAGRSDLIYDMNSRSDIPGYGYQLAKGATALTESWQALPTVSNNHFMLGHLMEWFYTGLCGIGQAPGSIGFKDIEIKPQPAGDIKEAKATYHSVNGLISVNWKIEGNVFKLGVAIPPNTKATIYFPAEYKKQPVKIGSGAYEFSVKQ
ncbi:family 78 glycoside hydrolase catalytic domain [Niabella hibiscisoli]|uniref:family 78 glycoside hydrolase catalytic domain n=1 Tax=Niabella hibiscisoli TaxID=1825928 RepID=UPI001F10A058|nr:family 78 glycoside hydrolase catalytic domain [Niabella hibiscisoli]MCH5720299.1 family 78 glycoside hydrolase catalytic domain [Niabella hibiscisoli]